MQYVARDEPHRGLLLHPGPHAAPLCHLRHALPRRRASSTRSTAPSWQATSRSSATRQEHAAEPIVNATLALQKEISDSFLPNAVKFHYVRGHMGPGGLHVCTHAHTHTQHTHTAHTHTPHVRIHVHVYMSDAFPFESRWGRYGTCASSRPSSRACAPRRSDYYNKPDEPGAAVAARVRPRLRGPAHRRVGQRRASSEIIGEYASQLLRI